MALSGSPKVVKLGVNGDVRGLIKALGDQKDVKVRPAAAGALGQIRNARAVEPAGATEPVLDVSGDPQILGGQVQQGAPRQRSTS